MSSILRLWKWVAAVASFFFHFTLGGFVVVGVMVTVFVVSRINGSGPSAMDFLPGLDNRPSLSLLASADVLSQAAEPEVEEVEANVPALTPSQRRVADSLAKRYRVSSMAIEPLVAKAFEVGKAESVDPLLILSVMAIESNFNPYAQSPVGAQGLMQVIPHFHMDKFEDSRDPRAWFDPDNNIVAGARVLKTYLRNAGSVSGALQVYAGAANDVETQYANKVLAEKQRLEQAAGRDGDQKRRGVRA